MNNLDKLLEAKKQLNKTLNEIKEEQNKLSGILAEKRKATWESVYDDLMKYSKYSKSIDTGHVIYEKEKNTVGFDIRKDCICVIEWSHYYPYNRGPAAQKREEPYKDCYYGTIRREEPWVVKGSLAHIIQDRLYNIIENWDSITPEIEKRLAESMEREMKKSIQAVEEKQIQLEDDLQRISGSEKEKMDDFEYAAQLFKKEKKQHGTQQRQSQEKDTIEH